MHALSGIRTHVYSVRESEDSLRLGPSCDPSKSVLVFIHLITDLVKRNISDQ
jgi:hypothetical protein